MSVPRLIAPVFAAAMLAASTAGAVPLQQYASTVTGFSSEYTPADPSWNAIQALGAPDTFDYGDLASAWAPEAQNNGLEWISVGFATSVYATGAVVRETYNNGFVYQIDAVDTDGNLHTLWSGADTSAPGVPFDFTVGWATTSFLVNGLKVYVDAMHSTSWEEIDAITLLGDTEAPSAAPVPEPASLGLLGLGLIGIAGLRRRAR